MIDATDRTLLALLQQDAQSSYADLGKALNLSAPAVHDRVKKLKRAGVLRRYTVEVDADQMGYPICTLVQVYLSDATCSDVAPHLKDMAEIEECHSVAGEACLVLKVRTESPKSLEVFLTRVWKVPGVQRTNSMLVLDTYFDRGRRVR